MARMICFSLLALFCVSVAGQGTCPSIVTRAMWGARPAKTIKYMTFPVPYAIITHTATPSCTTPEQCEGRVRSIQSFQMSERNFNDISYSFLIGGDGRVYEGVGWHKTGIHTRGYNSRSLGIALIGDFDKELPPENMLAVLRNLLACGVQMNELTSSYKLLAHRQAIATVSPGAVFAEELKTWPNWSAEP